MNTRPAPLVEVQPDPTHLATAVAGELLTRLAQLQSTGHQPHVVLTGGSIADRIHREIARMVLEPGAEGSVDWGQVDFWWGDERFVAADSPDRNAGQAKAALLDQLPVDPKRVHVMPDPSQGTLEDGVASYAAALADGPDVFDIVMLGVGPDGHIASLFPGFPQLDAEAPVSAVTDSPKPPAERITLTRPTLGRAKSVWFLVAGAEKASAVAAAHRGATVAEIPANGVVGHEETTWWLDSAAAAGL